MVQSRRLKTEEKEKVYCRKCMKPKNSSEFYSAVDLNLDRNGFMSVCKGCIGEMFEKSMNANHMILTDSIHDTCKKLNILYSEIAVDYLKSRMETMGEKAMENIPALFGLYKSHLGKLLSINESMLGTYEYISHTRTLDEEELANENIDFKEYLEDFWGRGLKFDEYEFLEKSLSKWRAKHSIDSNADEILVRELCFIELDLKKAREEGGDVSKLTKRLQEVMKTSALSPAQASAISSGKSNENFGEIIKQIEETTPAEFFADKELFKDYDGLFVNYIQDIFIRSIRNFITSVRDFNTVENIETVESDGGDMDELMDMGLDDTEGENNDSSK